MLWEKEKLLVNPLPEDKILAFSILKHLQMTIFHIENIYK